MHLQVVTLLSIFQITGWNISPVLSILLSLSSSVIVLCNIYMLQGFAEYLHTHHSHMLVRPFSRRNGLFTLLLRSGSILLVTTGLAVAVAFVFYVITFFHDIPIIRTTALCFIAVSLVCTL